MMTNKQVGLMVGFSFLLLMIGSGMGAAIYATFFDKGYGPKEAREIPAAFSRFEEAPLETAPTTPPPSMEHLKVSPPSFISAAAKSRPAVVHIKSSYNRKGRNSNGDFFSNPFKDFFDEDRPSTPKGIATGSGVLISGDGYIATNNHVIDQADEVEVTLFDNRIFKAKVIGKDITTDLALLKIEGSGLPHLSFGNSDQVQVGQWVLAVGNPMDLTSTVTAGIVSAKGRNINLLRADTELAIESFIQTDAAVNKGNSGGALVSLEGKLIGINTAIASKTGYYAGYSFAIPSSIVQKVMDDLLQYGEVKRGYLGVSIRPLDAALAEKYDLNVLKGALVTNVNPDLGAYEAGIRPNDVIISVNDIVVSSSSELQEQVSRYRPGEYVRIKIIRREKEMELRVLLKELKRENLASRTETEEEETGVKDMEFNGSKFRRLTRDEYWEMGVEEGIMVMEPNENMKKGGIREKFIITHIDGRRVRSLDELKEALDEVEEYITIKGQFDSGKNATYSFKW
ncbi:MAG: Do family serine endopeptidase [Bacteroidia bacterium]|nr:Do family serine endopeptidase [Bacteroidia bacterium]